MIELLGKIITNVLGGVYQSLWFALSQAILFMFAYKLIGDWKIAIKQWINWFRQDTQFRKVFFLAFVVVMMMFRTLYARTSWGSPLSNVIGVWGIYYSNGELATETIENVLLFVPFTYVLFWTFHEKIIQKFSLIWITIHSIKSGFCTSVIIEFLQLMLHVGTFQLSDIFFNTVGGILGGLCYFVYYRIKAKD